MFCAKVGKGGIKQCKEYENLIDKSVQSLCCLLITFANSFDPDQAQQIAGPDLDPNYLILSIVFLKEFF